MYNIKNYSTLTEFIEYNNSFISSSPMQNIFLKRVIDIASNGELEVLKAFNVVGQDVQNLLVLIVDGFCLIYCGNYNENSLKDLSNEIPFERLGNFSFCGDKKTIEKLLKLNNISFNVEKHLTIYKCENLNHEFKIANGKMRLASLSESNYLAKLSVDFTEEYDGNKESLQNMKLLIDSELKDNALFVWEDKEICTIAVEMNREEIGSPEIGQLYTVPAHRKKGYSSSLVFKLTEKILKTNNFCVLYTHGENPASNRSFIRVGYIKTGDYIRASIK